MVWVNLDDKFPKHPKIIRLSDAAFRLHVSGICYCSEQLTDGLLEPDVVPLLMPRFKQRSVSELVDRNLWMEQGLNGGSYFGIHDYLDWNRSRNEVVEERERLRKVRSDAGRKGAAARWQNR